MMWKVTSIVNSTNVDAHDFEPKTSDVAKLSRAQIIVANGAGYDSWATKSMTKTTNIVSAASVMGAVEGDNPHLWFSKDARSSMATAITDAYKGTPQQEESLPEAAQGMAGGRQIVGNMGVRVHQVPLNLTYAATEPVVYYLMADLGFKDQTPKGYTQSTASGGEPAPADLQSFQKLIEDKGVDVLVNNTQEASDATNMITGAAGRADVPVVDVSEQMPKDADTLNAWITSSSTPSSTRWIQAMAVKTPRTAIPRTATRIPMIPAPKAPPRMMPMRKTPRPAPVPARTPSTSVSARRPHPVTHLRIRQRPMPPMAIPAMPPATTRPTPANS